MKIEIEYEGREGDEKRGWESQELEERGETDKCKKGEEKRKEDESEVRLV